MFNLGFKDRHGVHLHVESRNNNRGAGVGRGQWEAESQTGVACPTKVASDDGEGTRTAWAAGGKLSLSHEQS